MTSPTRAFRAAPTPWALRSRAPAERGAEQDLAEIFLGKHDRRTDLGERERHEEAVLPPQEQVLVPRAVERELDRVGVLHATIRGHALHLGAHRGERDAIAGIHRLRA